jgi:hypothetical protein
MVRGDLFDPEGGNLLIEKYLSNKGGTWWPNAFTPAPETPRGTACMFSGNYPKENGVTMRGLGLREAFLRNHPSLFRSLVTQGVRVGVWREEKEIREGIWLPGDCLDGIQQFSDFGSAQIWANNSGDALLYRHDNAYHGVVDAISSESRAEVHSIGLDRVFPAFVEAVELLDWDIIWFVSDHGCKLTGDSVSGIDMLDRDRTNISLYLWEKNEPDQNIIKDDRLCSIFDLYPTIHRQFNRKVPEIYSPALDLQGESTHKVIWLEDYTSLLPGSHEHPDLFGERTENGLTICFEGELWFKSDAEKVWYSAEHRRDDLILQMRTVFTDFERATMISRRSKAINQYNTEVEIAATQVSPSTLGGARKIFTIIDKVIVALVRDFAPPILIRIWRAQYTRLLARKLRISTELIRKNSSKIFEAKG